MKDVNNKDNKDNINNIKPIRKGVPIGDSSPPVLPNSEIVEGLEELLTLAKSGILRELCYVGITNDPLIYSNMIMSKGDINYDPHTMHSELVHLEREFYRVEFVDWEEED